VPRARAAIRRAALGLGALCVVVLLLGCPRQPDRLPATKNPQPAASDSPSQPAGGTPAPTAPPDRPVAPPPPPAPEAAPGPTASSGLPETFPESAPTLRYYIRPDCLTCSSIARTASRTGRETAGHLRVELVPITTDEARAALVENGLGEHGFLGLHHDAVVATLPGLSFSANTYHDLVQDLLALSAAEPRQRRAGAGAGQDSTQGPE
jgi:hypothetical protein